jgi:hypothetical protein
VLKRRGRPMGAAVGVQRERLSCGFRQRPVLWGLPVCQHCREVGPPSVATQQCTALGHLPTLTCRTHMGTLAWHEISPAPQRTDGAHGQGGRNMARKPIMKPFRRSHRHHDPDRSGSQAHARLSPFQGQAGWSPPSAAPARCSRGPGRPSCTTPARQPPASKLKSVLRAGCALAR